jgi:hypothetical protein
MGEGGDGGKGGCKYLARLLRCAGASGTLWFLVLVGRVRRLIVFGEGFFLVGGVWHCERL